MFPCSNRGKCGCLPNFNLWRTSWIMPSHCILPTPPKKIQLEKVASGSDTHATLDRKLVSRVIDNLISNAVKFSNPDTRIQLVLESDDSTVSLKVEDEGPGIPEDEFHTLFKEFGRTSNLPT